MSREAQTQQGFTTVELLVTLLVASLLVVSGYQFYGVVNKRSIDVRLMAEAGNVAYEALRRYGDYQSTVTRGCHLSVVSSQTQDIDPSTLSSNTAALPDLSIQLIRCRPFTDNAILRVTAQVQYRDDASPKGVVRATYVSP